MTRDFTASWHVPHFTPYSNAGLSKWWPQAACSPVAVSHCHMVAMGRAYTSSTAQVTGDTGVDMAGERVVIGCWYCLHGKGDPGSMLPLCMTCVAYRPLA